MMEMKRLWADGPAMLEAEHFKLTGDSILLADFTPVRAGEKGVDLGCASGALMLLLLWRERGLRMTGVEIEPEAASLADENIRQNGLAERASVLCGDYRKTSDMLPNGGFDIVIANPPYFREKQGAMSPDTKRSFSQGMR